MEPIMKEKRVISSLIPYRKRGDAYEYYVQKRSATARVNPGTFGMFGGGAEGNETPQEALNREIKEELSYAPLRAAYLSRYEFGKFIFHVFIEEVGNDFESSVKIGEGDYGIFMTAQELFGKNTNELSPRLPVVILDLEDLLSGT